MHLYTAPLSLFARKVEIALHEKGLAFTREMVPFTQSGGYSPRHPAVLAANPKQQVPVFTDGDLTLYDSTIIIEYLEDAYPTPALFPADPVARARCRQWELFADEVMMDAVRFLLFRTEPPADPAARGASEALAQSAEDILTRHFATLDRLLAGQAFLCGGFSAADIAAFMVALYATRLGAPPTGCLANLATWRERLAQRPAFARVADEIAAADRALSYPWVG